MFRFGIIDRRTHWNWNRRFWRGRRRRRNGCRARRIFCWCRWDCIDFSSAIIAQLEELQGRQALPFQPIRLLFFRQHFFFFLSQLFLTFATAPAAQLLQLQFGCQTLRKINQTRQTILSIESKQITFVLGKPRLIRQTMTTSGQSWNFPVTWHD